MGTGPTMSRMDTLETANPRFDLRPFRALRLANSYVGDPASHRVFARPYRSVPARLREWRRKRHLILDDAPAVYVHEYTSAGVTIRGVVALVDLPTSHDTIFPHEGIQEAQMQQLAHRMEEMTLNPAPILLMHRGPESVRRVLQETTRREPQFVYTDRGDQLQRIWRITDPATIRTLCADLAGTHAVIADGHHRYAAARQLQEQNPGTGWDQTLIMLVDQTDTPLQLCAIHRTVPRLCLDAVAECASENGDLFSLHDSSHSALAKLDHALVLHDGQAWATLTPAAHQKHRMMICWLHEDLLPQWQVADSRLVFHHSATDAIARASHGVSILLPAPTFDQVDQSALSGHLLPQKATSFQPKPHLGVLMRDLSDE